MTFLLLVACIVVAAAAYRRQARRIDALEDRIAALGGETVLPTPPVRVVDPEMDRPTRTARVILPDPVAPPRPPVVEAPPASATFEQLVGGRLPIWVGGAALAIAGYFLVRLAIESGLLTPAVRVLLATSFGFALLAAGEGAARLRWVSEDRRVTQALSGAGIATLYAAIYLAGSHYGLVGPVAAFVLLAAITIAALALSLRRGAAVALMALVGGFATPLLAGSHGQAILPLIAYLGLLSAGLFGLAVARGWLWLALTAAAGSLIWSGLLIATAANGDALAAGGFALLLAVAATLTVGASGGARAGGVLRALPIVVGAAELALLIVAAGFGGGAWSLHLLLSAASIILAWREPRLVSAVAAALALSALALAGSALYASAGIAVAAGIGMALLFGGAGHALGRRSRGGAWWAGIGAAGLALPFLALWTARPELLPDAVWSALALLAMLAPLHLAWRSRAAARAAPPFDPVLAISATTAAAFLAAALAGLVPVLLVPACILAGTLALAQGGRRIGDGGLLRLSLVTGVCALPPWLLLEGAIDAFARVAAMLPAVGPVQSIEALLVPALLLGGIAQAHSAGRARDALRIVAAVAGTAAVAAIVPPGWRPLVLAMATAATGEAIRRGLAPRALLPIAGAATLLWAVALCGGVLAAVAGSLGGERLLLPLLPVPLDAVRAALLPAPLIALAVWRAADPRWRRQLLAGAGIAAAAGLYVLWKQVFRIADPSAFVAHGFLERALLTQAIFAAGWATATRGGVWARAARALTIVAALRVLWLDLAVFDPALVDQAVGAWPIANLVTLHFLAAALWIERAWRAESPGRGRMLALAALVAVAAGGTLLMVRQAFHGSLLVAGPVGRPEFYGYSAGGVLLAVALFARGAGLRDRPLRSAGLGMLTLMVLKVFLVDAAALGGLLRIASFLGLGVTLIAIGWAYGRLLGRAAPATAAG